MSSTSFIIFILAVAAVDGDVSPALPTQQTDKMPQLAVGKAVESQAELAKESRQAVEAELAKLKVPPIEDKGTATEKKPSTEIALPSAERAKVEAEMEKLKASSAVISEQKAAHDPVSSTSIPSHDAAASTVASLEAAPKQKDVPEGSEPAAKQPEEASPLTNSEPEENHAPPAKHDRARTVVEKGNADEEEEEDQGSEAEEEGDGEEKAPRKHRHHHKDEEDAESKFSHDDDHEDDDHDDEPKPQEYGEIEVQHIVSQEVQEPASSSLAMLPFLAALLSLGGMVSFSAAYVFNVFRSKKLSSGPLAKAPAATPLVQQSHHDGLDFEDLEVALDMSPTSISEATTAPVSRKMVQSQEDIEASANGWDNDLLSDAGWGDDSWDNDGWGEEDSEVGPAAEELDGELLEAAITSGRSAKPPPIVKGKAD